MGSVNKVILVGNLGKDPEVRYTGAGQAVANFSIATTESWTDKAGTKQEKTEWMRVVAWGKLAEVVGEHLAKGRQVYVEGKIQTREWTDKENVKRYTTEVVAQQVTFLGPKGEPRAPQQSADGSTEDFGPPPPGFDDWSKETADTPYQPQERSRGDGSQMGAVADRTAPVTSRPSSTPGAVFPNYGRAKNSPVRGASREDLEFYKSGCQRTLADSTKANWHEKEKALLAAIEAELGGGAAAPAPRDEDIPF